MLPYTRHEADPDLYRIEPYADCQFIYAKESGRPGEGSHVWATGTASWTLLNVWEHLLGFVPEMDSLHIDTCLPSAWTETKMIRQYRSSAHDIVIKKLIGVQNGNGTVMLDGKKLPGNVIPPQGDSQRHKVVVVSGDQTDGIKLQ